jgi:hypothetical protein
MNGETEQGIERLGGILQRRPRPTPGCSATEEEKDLIKLFYSNHNAKLNSTSQFNKIKITF